MANSDNNWRTIIRDIPILKSISEMSSREVLSAAIFALALYFGASGAYVLGFVVGLPNSLSTLINHATIMHLTGQLTFIALLMLVLFKVSRLIITGLLVFWNFLICKFRVAPKRPRGLRDHAVARLQRRMNNAVMEGRTHGKTILVARIAVVLLFCGSTFFTIVEETFTSHPSVVVRNISIFFGGLLAITGALSAYRVATSQTHKEFFCSPQGRKLAVVTALFLCMVLGMVRTFTMMQGPTVSYSWGHEVCHLAPMMPVFGGDLYFDRDSSNFVVMSSNKINFYIPHLTSKGAPACI